MYRCDSCGSRHQEWRPNCPNCGAPLKEAPEGVLRLSGEITHEQWEEAQRRARAIYQLHREGRFFPEGFSFIEMGTKPRALPLPPPGEGQAIRSGDRPATSWADSFAERHPVLDLIGMVISTLVVGLVVALLIAGPPL